MEAWTWLGAFLVGVVVAQTYLYWRATERRSDSGDLSGRRTTGGGYNGGPGAVGRRDTAHPTETDSTAGPDAEAVVRCAECRARNRRDEMFVYCRRCGERL